MNAELLERAVQLGRELHADTLRRFTDALLGGRVPSIPGPAGHSLAELSRGWRATNGEGSEASLAAALLAASRAAQLERAEEKVDLVWTGPQGERFGLLRIHQALLDLIGAAQREVLVVTYAAYEVDDVKQALTKAADRGVRVRVVAEHARADGGAVKFSPIPSLLGQELLEKVLVYYWPADTREIENGLRGSLHAKTAVADDRRLLVSSANFTGHALAINMELGVRVTGGLLPKRVREHFDELIRTKILQPVAT